MSAQPSRFPYEPSERGAALQPTPIMLVDRLDRIHWTAIWNGFFPALSTLVLFGLFGIGVNIVPQTLTAGLGPAQVIWTLVTVIVAFLIGGFVAASTAATPNAGWGIVNGLMVFLVALPTMMLLGALGLSAFFGGIERTVVLGTATNAVATAPAANLGWSFIVAIVGLISALVGGWAGSFAHPRPDVVR
jgi:hypothetical protein